MSYDLYFKSPKLDRAAFEEYFEDQRWFSVRSTERGAQAWYENEDTGVYLSFDWSDDGVALNVNYFRPSIFGLEAAEVVTAFVDAFAPAIHDPQSEGMRDGPYSREGFLRGWNAGNRFGHRAILSQHEETGHLVMPGARLQALWRWNYQRDRTADYIGELEMLPCFVPKISLVLVENQLRTMVVWDGSISILLPEVELVLMPRREGVVYVERRVLDPALAAWRIRPATDAIEDMQLGLAAREVVFEDDEVPAALTHAIAQHGVPFAGEGVGWDQLHDEELMVTGH